MLRAERGCLPRPAVVRAGAAGGPEHDSGQAQDYPGGGRQGAANGPQSRGEGGGSCRGRGVRTSLVWRRELPSRGTSGCCRSWRCDSTGRVSGLGPRPCPRARAGKGLHPPPEAQTPAHAGAGFRGPRAARHPGHGDVRASQACGSPAHGHCLRAQGPSEEPDCGHAAAEERDPREGDSRRGRPPLRDQALPDVQGQAQALHAAGAGAGRRALLSHAGRHVCGPGGDSLA
mmetsp:Transcript_5915/g.24884  ORF Transcript_5915/g.24884 Transcript_5915/m.24884 type:complete len:230 (+) Transcript_5915:1103-1792(+)